MAATATRYKLSRNAVPPKVEMPKRIALFSGSYNHIVDGVTLTLNRLVQYLEDHGHDVLVVAPTTKNPVLETTGTLFAVPSIPVPGRGEYRMSLGLNRKARKALAAFQPDLFHLATPDIVGLQALRLAKKWDIPVVASFHTHFASYLDYWGLNFLEEPLWKFGRYFYNQCEHVYVPTPSMAGVLKDKGITPELPLWPRGVETDRFNPEHRSLAWRRQLGIGDDEVIVTLVSRLAWEKGLSVYADVIKSLEARGIPHRSLIVGDGPARPDLEKQLPNTIFLGYLRGHDLARAYASSDVFLFPSETETFGNVTLEAMASGLPTVCANATGSDALVVPEQTGFLATPRATDEFLSFTERLVVDDTLRRWMGEQATQQARKYQWSNIFKNLTRQYDRILYPLLAPSGDGMGDGYAKLTTPIPTLQVAAS